MRSVHRLALASAAALALLAAGCGGRATATGKVTFNGSDVTDGTIGFVPTGGGDRVSVTATIENGKYAVTSADKLSSGPYQVQITWKKKTGKKVTVPGDAGNLIDEFHQLIPENYNTKTTLTADVKAGENTLSYELTGAPASSKGKAGGGGSSLKD